jgi:hypothetical protein
LEQYLRAFVADKPSLWVEWMALAEYWFNTNYHAATKLFPFEALYGYKYPKPLDFIPGITRVPVVEEFLEHRQQFMGILQNNLAATQARMKLQADKHRQERYIGIREWVFMRLQTWKAWS